MSDKPVASRTKMPDDPDEIEALRERVRAEHAAYMKKWAGWKPSRDR
ncbi:hypothetical protein [Ilumatobacter sp.]